MSRLINHLADLVLREGPESDTARALATLTEPTQLECLTGMLQASEKLLLELTLALGLSLEPSAEAITAEIIRLTAQRELLAFIIKLSDVKRLCAELNPDQTPVT